MGVTNNDAKAAFVRARRGCARDAKNKWLKAQGTKPGMSNYESLVTRWQTSRWLLAPEVIALSHEALAQARGALLDGSELFEMMMWPDGREDTYGGLRFEGSIIDFNDWLIERSRVVAEKGKGRVITPTTNAADGHRANESTLSLHALMLDCDGRGGYEAILKVLDDLNYCYVFYESGGHTPAIPKWRLVLPLAQPFSTRTDAERESWKDRYNTARTVFGSLSGLLGEGFDPATETPCAPWFITEKRTPDATACNVIFREGHAFDLDKLCGELPAYPIEIKTISRSDQTREIIQRHDVEVETILDELVPPMQKILFDRRDLYLALPGALLDKGIAPNDVFAIVEELSLRCPGDPSYTPAEIDKRHREHVHCAETTIKRFEKGATYTRIGTLYERWPEVVYAIDRALPHPMLEWARQKCASMLASSATSTSSTVTTVAPATLSPVLPTVAATTHPSQKPPTEAALKQLARVYRDKRLKPKDPDKVTEKDIANGYLIKRMLVGDPFTEEDDPEPLQFSIAIAIARVAGILAFVFPSNALMSTVLALAFKSLTKKRDFEGDPFQWFEHCYQNSLATRLERDAKEQAERDAKQKKIDAIHLADFMARSSIVMGETNEHP